MLRRGRHLVLILSIVLAYVVAEVLFPTPNVVNGGAVKMCLLIFLAVVFKATLEYVLSRRREKREKRHGDKPLA